MVRGIILLGCCFFSLLTAGDATGAVTSAQRKEVDAVKAAIDRAATHYKQQRYQECGLEIREAQRLSEGLLSKGDVDVLGLLEPSYRRLMRAHELLIGKGITLPPLKEWPSRGATPPKDLSGADGVASTGGVSFTKQIAPILVARCGRCHVKDSKGDYSMASYEAMMRGSSNGPTVVAGKPDESPMIELIKSGEMPPRGGSVPATDVGLLKNWITQGAAFDGTDKQANLASFVPSQTRAGAGQRRGGRGTTRPSARPRRRP